MKRKAAKPLNAIAHGTITLPSVFGGAALVLEVHFEANVLHIRCGEHTMYMEHGGNHIVINKSAATFIRKVVATDSRPQTRALRTAFCAALKKAETKGVAQLNLTPLLAEFSGSSAASLGVPAIVNLLVVEQIRLQPLVPATLKKKRTR